MKDIRGHGDARDACDSQFVNSNIELRPYQLEADARRRELVRLGVRRIVLVLPTGGGKTIIAAHIIADAFARGERVLFLAHRRELITQAVKKLVAMGIAPEHIGFMMADERRIVIDAERAVLRNPTAPVQVASVDTIRNRAKPHADLVFIDECHRALSRSYVELSKDYIAAGATMLGLTATPYRGDGKGLGDAFDELLVVSTPRQLIAEGYLVAPRVFTVPRAALPDLSDVRVRGGDYDERELARAVNRDGLVGNIVEHWKRLAEGRRTVAFSVNVEHSKHIIERFVAAGIPAEHLDGTTPAHERDAILARLERGETRVVANCNVLCEGWDQPSVKVCILARPTKSTGLYLQQAGRILRPWNGESALILDHAGCAMDHGLPQDDREFSLEGRKKRAASGPPCKMCPECDAVVPLGARECPECGYKFEVEGPKTEESEEQLVEFVPPSLDEKRAVWDELCRAVRATGRKPGWAAHRFKERFGTWPPNSFPSAEYDPGRVYTTQDKRVYYDGLVEECARTDKNPKWVAARYRSKFNEWPPRAWQDAHPA